ncbi:MAG: hypothetical protein IJ009_00180 [Clostridia bacterium]|nr:hypothetical protein [Clostridia bacterium]
MLRESTRSELPELAPLLAAGNDAGFFRFSKILTHLYAHIESATPALLAVQFGYSPALFPSPLPSHLWRNPCRIPCAGREASRFRKRAVLP